MCTVLGRNQSTARWRNMRYGAAETFGPFCGSNQEASRGSLRHIKYRIRFDALSTHRLCETVK